MNFQAVLHRKKEEKQGYKEHFVFVHDREEIQGGGKKSLKKLLRKNYNKIVDKKMDMALMTKRVNMLKQFETIFGKTTLGVFYMKKTKANLWANHYMRHNDMEISFLNNQKKLNDVNNLYVSEVQSSKFYTDLKTEQVNRLEPS